MTILDRLHAVPGTYWGSGDGPHSGPFIARVTVTANRSGSIDLDYEAWTQGAGLQHAERALIRRADNGHVVLESTLAGQAEPLSFQEGQPGVFGSLDGQQVGVVIDVREGTLELGLVVDRRGRPAQGAVPGRRAPVARAGPPARARGGARPGVDHPPQRDPGRGRTEGGSDDAADAPLDGPTGRPAVPAARPPIQAPWPGVLVLTGMGGVAALARDLAKEVPSAAIVRGDLLARAIVGTEVGDDREGGAGLEWRSRLAARLSREYAELGHAVVLAELESNGESGTAALLEELDEAGVGPVRLLVVDETTTAHEVLAELPRPGRRRSM